MKRARILLVDDEKIVLAGLSEEIRSAGYNVSIALSGKEAIEMVKESKPDIIFTDLVMPEMNGVEVCKKIKEHYPDIDVVLISGHPRELEKHLMEFLKAGGKDEFLRKPLIEHEIVEVAGKILKERYKSFL